MAIIRSKPRTETPSSLNAEELIKNLQGIPHYKMASVLTDAHIERVMWAMFSKGVAHGNQEDQAARPQRRTNEKQKAERF